MNQLLVEGVLPQVPVHQTEDARLHQRRVVQGDQADVLLF